MLKNLRYRLKPLWRLLIAFCLARTQCEMYHYVVHAIFIQKQSLRSSDPTDTKGNECFLFFFSPVVAPVESVHDHLMRPGHHGEAVGHLERLSNVLVDKKIVKRMLRLKIEMSENSIFRIQFDSCGKLHVVFLSTSPVRRCIQLPWKTRPIPFCRPGQTRGGRSSDPDGKNTSWFLGAHLGMAEVVGCGWKRM